MVELCFLFWGGCPHVGRALAEDGVGRRRERDAGPGEKNEQVLGLKKLLCKALHKRGLAAFICRGIGG